ncbi:MAG: MarR family winged helix-turn-helix transcriptional regulator [Fidelibacterota bacterium]
MTITLNALYRRSVANTGLTVPQSFVLSSIPDEGVDMSTLALRLGIDNSTATRLVSTLEKSDYVERRRDNSDARIVHVFLTHIGEEAVELLEVAEERLGRIVLNNIPVEKQEKTKEVLEEFLWNLSREQMNKG